MFCSHVYSLRVYARALVLNSFDYDFAMLYPLYRDRATYDPSLESAVNYTVASPADAPASLTYGPSFFDLAGEFSGDVTVGLNRQLNNQTASLAASVEAKRKLRNLFAFELGNEPECKFSFAFRFNIYQCEKNSVD